MKAAVLTNPGHGPPTECFTYQDYPKPTMPGPGWILVRVRSFGVNHAELRSRTGYPAIPGEFIIYQPWYHVEPCTILGEDMIGEVVDSKSAAFQPGEKVVATHSGLGKAYDGSYAQFAIVHERRLWHLPQNTTVPWVVLGALPMPLVTAWQSLMVAGRLGQRPKGATVVVHGAASTVGVFAMLIAQDHGATVIGTTRSKEKIPKLKQAGGEYVLLESELDTEVLKIAPNGVDIVIELVGCDQIMRGLQWCALQGTVVLCGILNGSVTAPDFNFVKIPTGRNLSFGSLLNEGCGGQDLGARAEDVEPIFAYAIKNIESGKWKKEQFIDSTYSLQDVGKAHERARTNQAVGRFAVTVPHDDEA